MSEKSISITGPVFRTLSRRSAGCGRKWFRRVRGGASYHRLLVEHAPRYETVGKAWARLDREVAEFLSTGAVRVVVHNPQTVTREGLLGNLLSYSYAPGDGEAGYDRFVEKASRLFDRHQPDGAVLIDHQTLLYVGQVT